MYIELLVPVRRFKWRYPGERHLRSLGERSGLEVHSLGSPERGFSWKVRSKTTPKAQGVGGGPRAQLWWTWTGTRQERDQAGNWSEESGVQYVMWLRARLCVCFCPGRYLLPHFCVLAEAPSLHGALSHHLRLSRGYRPLGHNSHACAPGSLNLLWPHSGMDLPFSVS